MTGPFRPRWPREAADYVEKVHLRGIMFGTLEVHGLLRYLTKTLDHAD